MESSVAKFILNPEEPTSDSITGPRDKESGDAEAREIERPDDDEELLPDEDHDFEENYGDLDGGNESEALPQPDKGTENF